MQVRSDLRCADEEVVSESGLYKKYPTAILKFVETSHQLGFNVLVKLLA